MTNTVVLVGPVSMSTKPASKVPTMAPAVPRAERRPTTLPVTARSCSWSLITTGDTALSTAAAGRKPQTDRRMT
jgi:hypothetical protein